jgi:hypothetical protein
MEHQTSQAENRSDQLSSDYLPKIKELGQATFFCFNESSQKLPVALIRHLDFDDDNTIHFECSYFPLTEQTWDVFAAELHCYRKGMPYSFVLHGVAIINDLSSRRVSFTIQHVESFDPTSVEENKQSVLSLLVKPYKYVFQKGASIISGFRKKESDMPFNNAAA